MSDDRPGPLDHLAAAYEKMLERVHETVERAEQRVPTLKQNLEQAREKAVELGELTREEAEKVASYMERDMQDAAKYIAETGQELRDWFRFDLEQMQRRMLDLFANVADQTSVQLKEMAEQWRQADVYLAGEVTGPGTLVCVGCGQEVQYPQPGTISPCPQCQGTEFRRRAGEEAAESEGADQA